MDFLISPAYCVPPINTIRFLKDINTNASEFVPSFSGSARSEEHTSELQSRFDLVCRLLLEKKKQYSDDQEKFRSEVMRFMENEKEKENDETEKDYRLSG